MKRYYAIATMLFLSSLKASSYGFSDYNFINPSTPYQIEGTTHYVDKAFFKDQTKGHLHYGDASNTLYYTHFIDEENSLTYGMGYDFLNLGWKNNPAFLENQFHYLNGSVGFVSTTLKDWRWVINSGFSVDTKGLNFGQSAVYHGMLWGRYDTTKNIGVNVGALGWYGVKNGRAFPIFGIDSCYRDHWKIQAIFPLDASISYQLDKNWLLGVMYENVGGPYKYPRRAHHPLIEESSPIFMIKSTGITALLQFNQEEHIQASLGAGWNLGGSLLIKDSTNHNGIRYPFHSAPYAQGNFSMNF
ncbi:hypothetical protein [Rhabdochlamydiaceae symbiont of Dictyostelium giganteum]|uniref:hypothetical protein n=1 Tax=Rhabdochlamydiaceae symbiont of Dictyostelium giganteum TaxID=3342349 RepID=UPI00384BD6C5